MKREYWKTDWDIELKCHQIRWALAIDQSKANHISSLTRVERDPYHVHSYKPKPSFMLLILKPWLDPKLLCTQARILLPVEMMLLRLMIDWGYCHVIHTIDKITGSLVMSIVSWKLCPIGLYESWNCTTCNLQTYCSKHESHCFSSVPLLLQLLPAREQGHVHY